MSQGKFYAHQNVAKDLTYCPSPQRIDPGASAPKAVGPSAGRTLASRTDHVVCEPPRPLGAPRATSPRRIPTVRKAAPAPAPAPTPTPPAAKRSPPTMPRPLRPENMITLEKMSKIAGNPPDDIEGTIKALGEIAEVEIPPEPIPKGCEPEVKVENGLPKPPYKFPGGATAPPAYHEWRKNNGTFEPTPEGDKVARTLLAQQREAHARALAEPITPDGPAVMPPPPPPPPPPFDVKVVADGIVVTVGPFGPGVEKAADLDLTVDVWWLTLRGPTLGEDLTIHFPCPVDTAAVRAKFKARMLKVTLDNSR